MKSSFDGPIFVVGMSRSGTKLLRDLLNQNPYIGLPIVESHFIPYLVKRFPDPEDLSNQFIFQRFYGEFERTAFFINMKDKGCELSSDQLLPVVSTRSWSQIFEFILRYYAPPNRADRFIWGDKSPGYVNHLRFLKKLFPDAKFIHIIRDPRDNCLSIKKTWGKNIYRAAERWRATISAARRAGKDLEGSYKEVYYEDLLDDPPLIMNDLCGYLGVPFMIEMTHLTIPSENLGDARGELRIVKENQKKYKKHLSPTQIRRIEEIVYPVMLETPFSPEFARNYRALSWLAKAWYKLMDGLSVLNFYTGNKGIHSGLVYLFLIYKKSSWRKGNQVRTP